MTVTASLTSMLTAAMSHPLLQAGIIIGGTFILEDAASVLTAVAAADGRVTPALGLASLYVGIALGDIGLYGLGRLAASHPWARRLVDSERAIALRHWLEQHLVAAVLSSRFLPGMRLPVYTACGFLGMPFRRFALAVIVATLIWTTLVFAVAYGFGSLAASTLGIWRWPIGLVIALLPFLVGRLLGHRHEPHGRGAS